MQKRTIKRILDKKYNKTRVVFQHNQTSKLCIYRTFNGYEYRYIDKSMHLFNGNALDLHGYCAALSKMLLFMFFEFAYKKQFANIKVITGPGPILKSIIEKQIQTPAFSPYIKSWNYKHGYFQIKLMA